MNVLGPYKNNYGRLFVVVGEQGNYKTVSYPRYLMEQKLGHPLKPEEDVHHIDGNMENNNIDNLKIVLRGEHQRQHNPPIYKDGDFVCGWCGKVFHLTGEQQRNRRRNKLHIYFCSKHCVGSYGRAEQLKRNL